MPTLGETRVRTTVNPANDSKVDQFKQAYAKLIDSIEELRGLEGIHQRLVSEAQTNTEAAAMWAVKAVTSNL